MQKNKLTNCLSIYLDTWAWIYIAKDNLFSNNLRDILLKKNGTILLSLASIIEISKLTDHAQIERIKHFGESIEWKIIKVIYDLVNINVPESTFDPIDNSLDRPINEILNGIPRTLPNFIEKVFQLPKKTNPIYDTWKEVVDCFNAALSRIRNSKNELAEWKKTWHNRNALTKKVTFPCAGTLQKFCIAFISNNETMKMESKEWLDVYHLIVPVAYAKFVLIDSRWTNFISQLGLNPPLIARTYNSTNKDQFLKEISAY